MRVEVSVEGKEKTLCGRLLASLVDVGQWPLASIADAVRGLNPCCRFDVAGYFKPPLGRLIQRN
jgi:hypothetical protein